MYNFIPIFSLDDDWKEEGHDNACLAYWCMMHKELVVNVKAFTFCFGNKQHQMYHKIINTFTHEVIHGVIQKILEKDRFCGDLNTEWPMLNGMDDNYARVVKRIG